MIIVNYGNGVFYIKQRTPNGTYPNEVIGQALAEINKDWRIRTITPDTQGNNGGVCCGYWVTADPVKT